MAYGYKMLVLDVDGTLLSPDGTVSPAVRAALQDARQEGLALMLATGRSASRTLPIARDIAVSSPLVTLGGSVIVSPTDQAVVHRQLMNAGAYRRLLKLLSQDQVPCFVYPAQGHGDTVVAETVHFEHLRPLVKYYLGEDRAAVARLDPEDTPLKVAVVEHRVRLAPMLATWKRQLADRLSFLVYHSPDQRYMGVEFAAKNCSKAAGVVWVLQQLGLSLDDVLAVGDDINDCSLLQQAGLGIAMANGQIAVKTTASGLTRSNSSDGVAWLIERWILTHARCRQRNRPTCALQT